MGRKLLCLFLALVLIMPLGIAAQAQQTHFIRVSELTYPGAGTTPDGFFLIFDAQSDLPDVELYGYDFSDPAGGEVVTFEAGKTYCLWLYLRRMEGDSLADCDVLVEGEPAEEILPFEGGWKVRKTFTIPAAETPEEEPAPTEAPTEPAPEPETQPEERPDPSQKEENLPEDTPEEPEEKEPEEVPPPEQEEGEPQEQPEDNQEQEQPENTPRPEPEENPVISTEQTEEPKNDEDNSTESENKPEEPNEPSTGEEMTMLRIAGENRYDTAFAAADACKDQWGLDKFSCILVASGTAFPDALSGSYLAVVRKAPILLVKPGKEDAVKDYIRENLQPGGTVYLLGGERAVPKTMEAGLDDFAVKRLGGADRYETNRLILQEAGVARKNIMVCTGKAFADALSASAAGMPILLVKDSLSTGQKDLLRHGGGGIYVVGGVNAVSAELETELNIYGAVERLAGDTRYDTSARIARRFFPAAQTALLASGKNFPDALCGGVLAYAQDAPLLLTCPGKENPAREFAENQEIFRVCVLGGTQALPEETVKQVLRLG